MPANEQEHHYIDKRQKNDHFGLPHIKAIAKKMYIK